MTKGLFPKRLVSQFKKQLTVCSSREESVLICTKVSQPAPRAAIYVDQQGELNSDPIKRKLTFP